MKLWKLLPILLLGVSLSCLTEGEVDEEEYKLPYDERIKMMEERFFAASKQGKTVTGVIVEGNSLFNGTTEPQNKPYPKPYTLEEYEAVAISAERNSKLFILTEDGALYYPTPKKGQINSESEQARRMTSLPIQDGRLGQADCPSLACLPPKANKATVSVCSLGRPGPQGLTLQRETSAFAATLFIELASSLQTADDNTSAQ